MLPLSRVEFAPQERFDPASWYLEIPAIAEVCSRGIEFSSPVTVMVGENGAGKSTLVEAIAGAWQSGFTGAQDRMWSSGTSTEDSDLPWHLRCVSARPRPHGGCFLRAE